MMGAVLWADVAVWPDFALAGGMVVAGVAVAAGVVWLGYWLIQKLRGGGGSGTSDGGS